MYQVTKSYGFEILDEHYVRGTLDVLGVQVNGLLETAAYIADCDGLQEGHTIEVALVSTDASDPANGVVCAPEFGWEPEDTSTDRVVMTAKVYVRELTTSYTQV